MPADRPNRNPLEFVRRFARPSEPPQERCDLCSAGLGAEHAHLVEPAARRIVCACDACALLFSNHGSGRYRRVPRRVEVLSDLNLTDVAWAGLGLPVNLAFFLHSSTAGRVVAVYPSPAGATEAAVPQDAWDALAEGNPVLRTLEPDVEALLVNRVGEARDHFRVGIDVCYRLVGVIRTHWQGFSGGPAWDEVGRFFAGLRDYSRPAGVVAHA